MPRDTRSTYARKEVLQIHPQTTSLPNMASSEADRVSSAAESMSGVVQRDSVQEILQDDPLNGLELLFRRLDQTFVAGTFFNPAANVVNRPVVGRQMQAGEPTQSPVGDAQMRRQFFVVADSWQVPVDPLCVRKVKG